MPMTTEPTSPPWYRDRALHVLLAFTLGLYGLRASVLPVFGEETRRAVIAREMLASGDWLVPRVQGVPRLSRPPMQNWMIAVSSFLTGEVDIWAIRLPSLLCTLFTVSLIFGYSFRCAGKRVAVLATLGYITSYEALEYGRSGETEAVFTGFVAGSLLLWHWGYREGWNRWWHWPACYALVAGGMLTKGIQAPLYFSGAVMIYLWSSRRLRELLHPAHFLGWATFVAMFGGWQLAYMLQMGLHDAIEIHWFNIAARFTDQTNHSFLEHFLLFPFEVFAVMLPGSLLLLPAWSREIRRSCLVRRDMTKFLVIAAAWAFLFVWIPPGSRARYYMPLMPVFAVLMGIVGNAWLSLPRRGWSESACRRLAMSVAAFCAFIVAGPLLSIQARMCEDVASQIAALKTRLPAGERLMSIEQMHHGFLYYYEEPVQRIAYPQSARDVPAELEYFAIHTHDCAPPQLPFTWEEIGVVTCDRYTRKHPRVKIHIGRRVALQVADVPADVIQDWRARTQR